MDAHGRRRLKTYVYNVLVKTSNEGKQYAAQEARRLGSQEATLQGVEGQVND